MSWLYSLAQPFVWHPGRILLVAIGWVVLALTLFRTRRRPILVVAGAWTIFAGLELEAWRERSDIRVDLLLTWPALCVITVVCVVLASRRGRKGRA